MLSASSRNGSEVGELRLEIFLVVLIVGADLSFHSDSPRIAMATEPRTTSSSSNPPSASAENLEWLKIVG